MSEILEKAAAALNDKLSDGNFDASARFAIVDPGSIFLDASGARVSDEEADVTLSADADTFKQVLGGDLNPTDAFMSGKLRIDGDMGIAMKLASVTICKDKRRQVDCLSLFYVLPEALLMKQKSNYSSA